MTTRHASTDPRCHWPPVPPWPNTHEMLGATFSRTSHQNGKAGQELEQDALLRATAVQKRPDRLPPVYNVGLGGAGLAGHHRSAGAGSPRSAQLGQHGPSSCGTRPRPGTLAPGSRPGANPGQGGDGAAPQNVGKTLNNCPVRGPVFQRPADKSQVQREPWPCARPSSEVFKPPGVWTPRSTRISRGDAKALGVEEEDYLALFMPDNELRGLHRGDQHGRRRLLPAGRTVAGQEEIIAGDKKTLRHHRGLRTTSSPSPPCC